MQSFFFLGGDCVKLYSISQENKHIYQMNPDHQNLKDKRALCIGYQTHIHEN